MQSSSSPELSGTGSTFASLDPVTSTNGRIRPPRPRGPALQTMESKLTTRSQEAIAAARRLAVDRGQASLRPLHRLVSLLEQTDGIAAPLLQAAGADPSDVRSKADAAIRRLPSVSGATVPAPSPSRDFLRVL